MTIKKKNDARVHIKSAILTFPELFEDGTPADDDAGKVKMNRASFIIDTKAKGYKVLAAALDEAVKFATKKEFGKEHVKFNKTPIKAGEAIKGKDGKPLKKMAGKISITSSNFQRPTLLNSKKEDVGIDHNLFYAGAEVYGIIEFIAKKVDNKKYLNARLCGILHIADGTPLERKSVDIATADEFELDE